MGNSLKYDKREGNIRTGINDDSPEIKRVWETIVQSAKDIIKKEPFLTCTMQRLVTKKASFGDALCSLLSEQLANCSHCPESWMNILSPVFRGEFGTYNNENIMELAVSDLIGISERDPACTGYLHAFLNFKGYKSLQLHRLAHILWTNGRVEVALFLQSKSSELWGVDIHPAAVIGSGLMIDHATGVVIGETARIGKNCSFLHGVTLGSTGKDKGDRHPKLGNDVLIGCNATLLGNILIGDSAKIGSGSIVLKSIPSCATAVGNPARVIGSSTDLSGQNMDHGLHHVMMKGDVSYRDTIAGDDET